MHRRLIQFCFVACLAPIACGCDGNAITRQRAAGARASSLDIPACDQSIVKLVLLEDQTWSSETTKTERIQGQALDSAIEIVRARCGELLLGAIRDRSNRPFLRVEIPPAPLPPVRPASNNVFDQADAMAVFNRANDTFTDAAESWQADVDRRISDFRTRAADFSSIQSLASRSAIGDAINRADTALAEAGATGGRTSEGHRWIVLASDGESNVGTPIPRSLRSGARLVIANGIGTRGLLDPKVELFEGLKPALKFVGDCERRASSQAPSEILNAQRQ
jgi:hypothetical protein